MHPRELTNRNISDMQKKISDIQILRLSLFRLIVQNYEFELLTGLLGLAGGVGIAHSASPGFMLGLGKG